jgi:predicted GIY-YIG superfamily endonuclease
MQERDTYKYVLKDKGRDVYFGTTNDLERREQEHRYDGKKFDSMEKVGRITTHDAAGAWEAQQIVDYKNAHHGHRPKYNLNDSGK